MPRVFLDQNFKLLTCLEPYKLEYYYSHLTEEILNRKLNFLCGVPTLLISYL